MTTCRSQPDLPGILTFEIVDFKVTDPGATNPNAPVFSLDPNQGFKFVVIVKGGGSTWTFNNYPAKTTWTTKFFANALGIDVVGEVPYPAVAGALTPEGSNYKIELNVPAGLSQEGLYELGVLVRLPGAGVNGSCDELHIEVAAP